MCLDLGERREVMVKIAEDIGRLYREQSFYNGWSFDWLYAQNGERILKTLEKKAEKSENIAAYLRESKRVEAEELQNRENRRPSPIAEGKRLKQATREEQLAYMELYLREQEPKGRSQALRVFTRCPYPGDLAPVVADMDSEDPHLRLLARWYWKIWNVPRCGSWRWNRWEGGECSPRKSWKNVFMTAMQMCAPMPNGS